MDGETAYLPENNITNTTSNDVAPEIQNSSQGESDGGASKFQLVVFLSLTLVNIIQNTRVIAIVATMPRKRQRTGNLLIAHLSATTLLLNYVAATYMLKQWNLSPFAHSRGLCIVNSYIRNLLVSVVPANVTAISYQRSTIFQPSYQGEKLLVRRSLLVIWIVATVGNLPVIFMVGLTPTGAACLQYPFLGSLPWTVVYELLKLVVYNVAPMCYICYALFQIKSKVSKYIFMTKSLPPTTKTREKVQKLRLVFLNGLTFIILWLPAAVLLSLHKVFKRVEPPPVSTESPAKKSSGFPIYFCPMVIAYHVYFILHPLIHLHLNEDLRGTRWWSFTYTQHRDFHQLGQRQSPEALELQDREGKNGSTASSPKDIALHSFNTVDPGSESRVSTFAVSTAASVTVHGDSDVRSAGSGSDCRAENTMEVSKGERDTIPQNRELLV